MSFPIPRDTLMKKVHLAFLDHGYDGMTMITLAKAMGVARSTLYNYFPDKEQAFRGVVRWGNALNIAKGQMAAAAVKTEGADAVEILVAFMDARFADMRREVAASPYAIELNNQVYKSCWDILLEVATTGQARLAELLVELQETGLVQWRADYSPTMLAQFFFDIVRGINLALPPKPAVTLPDRYREMFAALLSGVTA